MRKIYSVRLTDAEVDQLKNLIRKKSATETLARRCHILLDMDENHVSARMSYAQCAKEHGASYVTVAYTVKRYATEGLESVLKYHRNESSNNARRKVDGRMLYKKFPPEKAHRILSKLEIHYTPKHGSWLDVAEIE